MGSTVLVILGAGGGTRFAGSTHKLDAMLGAKPLLLHAVDAARASEAGPVVVVVGAGVTTTLPSDVTAVANPDWTTGQGRSLRLGLDAARALDPSAVAVVAGLGDQPGVLPSAWRLVADAADPDTITVATYADPITGIVQRGHPVALGRNVWSLLEADAGHDRGARELMRLRPELVRELPCQGSIADVDTWEDLQTWLSSSSTSSPSTARSTRPGP